ncbi:MULTISPECIES: AraC family transcriptional regulator [unclassified Microcella]|uniref:AraC family transcriptional regulator n=1 Tax=unclassified Microcella TaxID=2630066 RepID=UPI0006F5B15F|nr:MULTISPECIES: AraC family transcriptional regulator [unclassified Microcella]KQV25197.1 AraC family transcriptional regulator [Yonghaparkia sp. Root332]KRF31479.1 AraC family transcriptional regulator [Yonghaparkia sp. Soil809]
MEGWNRAIELIDERLGGDIDAAELARVALTSEYHFRRMFSTLAGMPLSEYIRRRRLTVAAAAVRDGRESLSDIAVRFGYGSADSFSRAFSAVHGIGPEQARRPGAVLRSQPRLSFHLTIEGSTDMEYRIVTTEEFRIVGRSTRAPIVFSGPNPAIESFERSVSATERARLAALSDREPTGVLSVCDEFADERVEGSMLRYTVGVATMAEPSPEDDVVAVAAGSWLVIEGEGQAPEAIQQLWARAYAEWLPANPYRLRPGPELLSVEPLEHGRARGELWLPVEPAS